MFEHLRPIGYSEIESDMAAMREVYEVATTVARFGERLRVEGHPQWWILNDVLDDMEALKKYLNIRLGPIIEGISRHQDEEGDYTRIGISKYYDLDAS